MIIMNLLNELKPRFRYTDAFINLGLIHLHLPDVVQILPRIYLFYLEVRFKKN